MFKSNPYAKRMDGEYQEVKNHFCNMIKHLNNKDTVNDLNKPITYALKPIDEVTNQYYISMLGQQLIIKLVFIYVEHHESWGLVNFYLDGNDNAISSFTLTFSGHLRKSSSANDNESYDDVMGPCDTNRATYRMLSLVAFKLSEALKQQNN